jgi:hypothetical protein
VENRNLKAYREMTSRANRRRDVILSETKDLLLILVSAVALKSPFVLSLSKDSPFKLIS